MKGSFQEYELVKILKNLVDIPSFGEINEHHKILDFISDKFSLCKEIAFVNSEPNNTNLLIGVNTKLEDIENCILLSGHIDTVPPKTSFQKSILKSGKLYGLGTSDMKAFTAVAISKLDTLLNLNTPVVLSLTSDEETKFNGIKENIKTLKSRNVSPKLVVVGEPTNLKFSNFSRGATWFTCSFLGKACHASTPNLGVNAISHAAKAITEIDKLSERLKNSSLTVTKIHGGQTGNIVPENCTFKIDARLEKYKQFEIVKSRLYSIFLKVCKTDKAFELTASNFTVPFERRDSKFLSDFANEHNIEVTSSNFTTEAGVIQQAFKKSDIIIFGPGNPQSIHSENEYIDTNSLIEYSKLLPTLLQSFDETQSKTM